jgi:hypothetical protein
LYEGAKPPSINQIAGCFDILYLLYHSKDTFPVAKKRVTTERASKYDSAIASPFSAVTICKPQLKCANHLACFGVCTPVNALLTHKIKMSNYFYTFLLSIFRFLFNFDCSSRCLFRCSCKTRHCPLIAVGSNPARDFGFFHARKQ